MTIKKIKKKKPFVLEIDQEAINALGIAKKSDVQMILMDDMLVIKHKAKKCFCC